MRQRFLRLGALMGVVFMMVFSSLTLVVSAVDDINDVVGNGGTSQGAVSGQGGQSSQSGLQSGSVADGLARAFDATMIDNDDMDRATQFISPYARVINVVIGAILGSFSVALMLVTVLDLVYLMIPPFRKILDREQTQQSNGMMGGGMMGMMNGMGQQTQQTGVGRFVSDEAKSALMEAQASMGQQTGGGMMGGGMMGMMSGMGQQTQPKAKTVILLYAKKRAFTLVIFFACVVLFTSTLFTDIGLRLGQWIIDTIGSAF